MDFHAVKGSIQPGDVLLCRGRALHSRIIQRVTNSVYSHVGIAHTITTSGRASLDILEAKEGAGIQTWPLQKYLEQGTAVDWYTICDHNVDREKVVQWCFDRRGNRYASHRQLLRSFVTIPLFESLGLPTRIDRNRRFCSFIAAEALLYAGWQPPAGDEITPELTSPGGVSLFTCLQRIGPLTINTGKR